MIVPKLKSSVVNGQIFIKHLHSNKNDKLKLSNSCAIFIYISWKLMNQLGEKYPESVKSTQDVDGKFKLMRWSNWSNEIWNNFLNLIAR